MGPSSMVLPFPHHHQGSSQPLPPPWSPCLHCHLCNSTLPWSRENNESEAQLIGFLTLTCSPGAGRKMILKHSRSCCSPASEPSVPNLLGEISQYTDMKIMREGMRTYQERKKKAIEQSKTSLLPSGQSPTSWGWHLKPSVTWSSTTSSASCPSTLASHGWHSTKSQMRHCCFPPRAGAALLLLPTLPGVAQGPPPPGSPPTPLAS